MDRDELLQSAEEHCFFTGLDDSGAALCKANMVYGIAGIHSVQRQLGVSPNATFIATPDMTITRNKSRWKSGFGYGGKISWGSGNDDFIVLDTKPNACGMLVGGLERLPDVETLIRRLRKMKVSSIQIEEIDIRWEFFKNNHFIDVFRVIPIAQTDIDLCPYAFILHESAVEFSKDNSLGFGLAHNNSKQLHKMAKHFKTPFGKFHVVVGDAAVKYLDKYRYVEAFAQRKRRLAAELLFGEFIEISNETHQGLINMNEILLGCHHLKDEDCLFPLVLRGDLPAYLVKGIPNLSSESIALLGFENRARELGVYDKLLGANVFPHGGGYTLPNTRTVNRVIEVDKVRYFELEIQKNGMAKKIVSEVRSLAYEYRGEAVTLRALEIGLIEIVAKLIPQYVLKI